MIMHDFALTTFIANAIRHRGRTILLLMPHSIYQLALEACRGDPVAFWFAYCQLHVDSRLAMSHSCSRSCDADSTLLLNTSVATLLVPHLDQYCCVS